MSRNVTDQVGQAAAADTVRPFVLVELDFPEKPVRVWSGVGALTWDGQRFEGVGDLGKIGTMSETTELMATNVTLELSGIPTDQVDHVDASLREAYQGRAVRIWYGFFDEFWAVIPSPVLVWAGVMDAPEITDNGSSITVSLSAENRLVDMSRVRVRRYTDADQQERFPGDRACEYVPALQDAEIPWGKETTA